MTFEDPRRVLGRHGLAPKRRFSQNFLCSPKAVSAIAEATGAGAGDTVVELGPGCGTLTAALLDLGANVLAIERDPDMIRLLGAEFPDRPLTVRDGDAAAVDYPALARELGPVRLAGNLPYAITGGIMRNLIDHADCLQGAVIMVQHEVAERLRADPGSRGYGALTVFIDNVFEVRRVLRVPATAFHPPPKVDSAVVHLAPRDTPRVPADTTFEQIVHATFQGRRKTLRNCLRRMPDATPERVEAALAAAAVTENERGERLSVDRFGALATAWKQHS